MKRTKVLRNLLLRRLGLERSYRPAALVRHPQWSFENYLMLAVAHYLRARTDFTFLQIGAFDGVSNDPINSLVRTYGLRGIVVEPQPAAFEALKACYAKHPQVIVVNAAIADTTGVKDFYVTREGPSQLASFDKAHLLKHKIPAEAIVHCKVPCVTVADLLKEHRLARLDLIQIDAEGYDAEIIRTIDLQSIRPSIIRFEHRHLTDLECTDCMKRLAAHGYQFIAEQTDTIALLDESAASLKAGATSARAA